MNPGKWTHKVGHKGVPYTWYVAIVDGRVHTARDLSDGLKDGVVRTTSTTVEEFYATGVGYTVTKLNKFKGNK